MRALAGDREMGALEVEAEKARNALLYGLPTGLHGGEIDLDGIGNQRGQECRGAELPVRSADGADARYRGIVVEKHPAAAIDLQVDKARDHHSATEMNGV